MKSPIRTMWNTNTSFLCFSFSMYLLQLLKIHVQTTVSSNEKLIAQMNTLFASILNI